jgi:osmotically-inducible protein OsmY
MVAAALGLAACAVPLTPDTRTPQERANDRAIVAKVQTALSADPYLDTDHLTVSARQGVVRLSGLVGDDRDLRAVLRIANAVPGVRGVDDELEIYDFTLFGRGPVR